MARRIASWSMSIAAITAVSASSEYGGRRSRKASGGGGAIENSTGELDIFPRRPLPGGIPEKRCRVIGDDHGNTVIVMLPSPQLAEGFRRFEQGLRGGEPQRQNHGGADNLYLAHQIWKTGLH